MNPVRPIQIALAAATLLMQFIPLAARASQLPSPEEWTVSAGVATEIDGAGTLVCLSRPGSAWQARIIPRESANSCGELVIFSVDSRAAALAFPGIVAFDRFSCAGNFQYQGAHPCTSAFSVQTGERAGDRRIDADGLEAALAESGSFRIVTDHLHAANARMQEAAENAARQRRAECESSLDRVASVAALDTWWTRCQADVTESSAARSKARRTELVREENAAREQTAERLRQAGLTEMRQSFAALNSDSPVASIKSFLDEYSGLPDPNGLIGQASAFLEQARARDAAADAARNRAAALKEAESAIRMCNQRIAGAKAARAREKRISAESGYENPAVLRDIAEAIVICEEIIDHEYSRYLELGGLLPRDRMR